MLGPLRIDGDAAARRRVLVRIIDKRKDYLRHGVRIHPDYWQIVFNIDRQPALFQQRLSPRHRRFDHLVNWSPIPPQLEISSFDARQIDNALYKTIQPIRFFTDDTE